MGSLYRVMAAGFVSSSNLCIICGPLLIQMFRA